MVTGRELSEENELRLLTTVIKEYVPSGRRRLAVDGGANVGNWTLKMAQYFTAVVAYEPVEFTFKELQRRVGARPDITIHRCALMGKRGKVTMVHPKKRSASTSYYAVEGEDVPATRLDDEFATRGVDLIKLDLEGAEAQALRGGLELLARCKPVVIVEVIPRQLERYGDTRQNVDAILKHLGYRRVLAQEPNRVYAA